MGKRASEYQRAYQSSPTRDVDEEYKSNYEYRRLRRSAEMAHRVIEWPYEDDENEIIQDNPKSKKLESKKQKSENSEKLKTQKTQTSARKLGLEAATQTPEKPTQDVSVNGDVSVTERESRSVAKERAAKTELTLKAERKPKGTASDPDTKAKVKQNRDDEPEIAKLNLREHDAELATENDDEKPVPKIDIVELLKGVRTQPAEADSKRKRPTQQKKRVEEPSGRVASASKQRGRVQALFEVESNRHNSEVTSTKRPFNLYLFGAGDRSRNGVAVKRTYNVSAPHGAVHETALRAAKRRDAERASARRRKRPTQRGSTKAGPDDPKGSVEQNEFEKWMRRETSQWTTEYRSNFKQHDRTEYARNREIAARCSVLRDDEDLLAIALNPNFDAEKSNGHSKQSANPNPKVKLNFVPSSTRSASARSTSTRSAKSGGSGSSRLVE